MAISNQRSSENIRSLNDFEKAGRNIRISSLCGEEEVKMIGCPQCGQSHIIRKIVSEVTCVCGAEMEIKKRWFEK